MSNHCGYFPNCTGCTSWDKSYDLQTANKIRNLKDQLALQGLSFDAPMEFISVGEMGLRHRADFSFIYDQKTQKTKFGFFNLKQDLIHIDECLQYSPELQIAFQLFINITPRTALRVIEKGSVRIRVAPNGERGCWLDMANVDIKDLLNDGIYLQKLMDADFKVEMGQKAKRVQLINNEYKLVKAQPEAWFQTVAGLNLKCHIADFTQPSWLTGNKLVSLVNEWIYTAQQTKNKTRLEIIEFGAGIGQFTLPFLKQGHSVTALEIESAASSCLHENANLNSCAENLKILNLDFHRSEINLAADVVFANPARSGLKQFNEQILKCQPEFVIYVSCFASSLCQDLKVLSSQYEITDIKLVDQFPQTNHYETCVFLKKKTLS